MLIPSPLSCSLHCLSCNPCCHCVVIGLVSTIAGGSSCAYGDGVGTAALFHYPNYLTVDPNGRIIVADTSNNRIRMILTNGNNYYEYDTAATITATSTVVATTTIATAAATTAVASGGCRLPGDLLASRARALAQARLSLLSSSSSPPLRPSD